MKLSLNELLHGSIFNGVGRKAAGSPASRARVGELGKKTLDRTSIELNRARLVTRRHSLENALAGAGGGVVSETASHEELHVAIPRQDSITLAKRRLSHDVHAAAGNSATAGAAAGGDHSPTHSAASSASNCWHITASEQQQAAA